MSLLGEEFLPEARSLNNSRDAAGNIAKVTAYLREHGDKPAVGACTLLDGPIAAINDKGLQALLREVERDDLCRALAKSAGRTKARFFGAMTARMAALVIDDMNFFGWDNVADARVVREQEKILEKIYRLEESGEVILSK